MRGELAEYKAKGVNRRKEDDTKAHAGVAFTQPRMPVSIMTLNGCCRRSLKYFRRANFYPKLARGIMKGFGETNEEAALKVRPTWMYNGIRSMSRTYRAAHTQACPEKGYPQ